MTPPKRQPQAPSSTAKQLTKERLVELQARVDSDYYDSPTVLDSLAGRLIDSGDLGSERD
ncbi:MAG: hypothetical protein ACR2QM_18930 [Longimicrobiales bacterium]